MLVVLLLVGLVPADSSRPTIAARFTTDAPVIDGELEDVWQQADPATNFTQLTPNWDSAATDLTTACVLYDRQNIYVAFRCFVHDPKTIRARLSDTPDGVRLFFDTFEDRNSCYQFVVNASGTEQGYRLTENGTMVSRWDGVWRSAVKVADWGYAVELAIPFKTLRYPPTKTTWGVDFGRYTVTRGEKSFWCRHQQTGFRVENMGRLTGITPPPPGLHLEVYPVALGRAAKTGEPWRDSLSAAAGLDVSWLPTPTANIQLTVLPDFAQIEADPYQLNLTKYELWLAERRPFFTEAQENFGSAVGTARMFYSRRIGKALPDGSVVPILGGLKYTDRWGRYQVGALAALTGATDYDYYGSRLTEPQSWFSVASLRRGIFDNSEAGLLYAGKDNAYGHNNGLRADATLRFGELTAGLVGAASLRYDTLHDLASLLMPGTSDSFDWATGAGLSYETSTFTGSVALRHVGPEFDMNGPGFTTWRGQELSLNAGPVVYNRGPFRYAILTFSANANREWDYKDPGPDWGVTTNPYAIFQNRCGLELWGGVSRSRYQDQGGTEHRYSGANLGCHIFTDESQPVSGWVWADFNTQTYNYNRQVLAPSGSGGGHLMVQVGDRAQVSTEANLTLEFPERGGSSWQRDVTVVLRPRLDYALSPKMTVGIGNEIVDAAVGDGMRAWTYRLTGLYSYTFLPRSTVYFAWNMNLGEDKPTELVQVIKLHYLFVF